MNVRKLMARLNPGTIRYDGGGGGGIPTLTPQDVAGALGMVPDSLGRELLCHLWWPDGARLTRRDLHDKLAIVQFEEFDRLMDTLRAAQLAAHLAEHDGLGSRTKAQTRLEDVRAQMWPGIGPHTRYRFVREAVLAEMATPAICTACAGRGQILRETLVVVCATCNGIGRKQVSARRRATAIGCDESSYRRSWRLPYEYLLAYCVDAEDKAARLMKSALGNQPLAA